MERTDSGSSRWFGILGRVFLMTFLLTLLTFAVTLLLSIVGTVAYAQMHHVAPNFRLAYRWIAFPCAITAGAIVLVLSVTMEIQHYRQRKILAGIERVS
jgi:heme/copper-type cytochrome/quinol oxidase subunit 2